MRAMWRGAVSRFRTIVADPPWRFGSAATKADARKHYETMPLGEIQGLPVEDMAEESAHLWLWAVNGLMEEAYTVARAWGFRPITLLTWCKTQPGVGYYLRNNTEHAILAIRGEPIVPDEKLGASYFIAKRGEHSAKPDVFYDYVEQISPGPYLELFARRARFGWDYWGDQSLGTAEMPEVAA
jgi:N6-adenosine-specific RNA methylase IME4